MSNIKDSQIVIFTDDDVGYAENHKTAANRLKKLIPVHESYNKYNVIHGIGYITGTQQTQKDTTNYLLSQKNISIQLHAHHHCDFTTLSEDRLRMQFDSGIKIIQDVFNTTPTTWYPPFHARNELTDKIASEYGLVIRDESTLSPLYFLRKPKSNFYASKTICHHFWSDRINQRVEPALKVYRSLLDKAYSELYELKYEQ